MNQEQALAILKTGANVFLTGEPGAGKTHTVNAYVSYLRSRGVEPAITASTGIAATHIGGMTIHSWSGIGIARKLDKSDLRSIATSKYIAPRATRTRVLIIDEVSMLAPETLTMVDMVCRAIKENSQPFGGLQVVFVGDFFQLPPVQKFEESDTTQVALLTETVGRFAYESSAWARANPTVCYLTEQYRQDDQEFLSVLTAIRRNEFNEDHARSIESRKITRERAPEHAPKLFTHNADVDRVNANMLAKLQGAPHEFSMSSQGKSALVSALKKGCLSPETLYLKVGASVMCTKNNPKEGFVNGTLGTITGFSKESGAPIIKIRNGRQIEIEPMDWIVEDNGMVRARITQFPLRLAWAITVHKSQGMSMDEAVMDLSGVFEFGQGYVALSRVRRLSGLHLLGWNERAFSVHPDVLSQDESWRAQSSQSGQALSEMSQDEIKTTHDNFIIKCGGTLDVVGARRPADARGKKTDTLDSTLALWQSGKAISEIAQARAMSPHTIFGHIEELVEKEKIRREELSRLLTPALTAALSKIHTAFQELDTKKLSPVFEKLNGSYSYDDLRIARMLLS
ncbi:MAG: AAA family ATPase [bacterium]|nr:AAA family ATPase [bacterium]